MWERSFIATSVALGGTVNDALTALGGDASRGAAVDILLAGLRAPDRPARAAALAGAVRDIVVAIDEATLR
jgi:hypothetical protein